MRIHVSTMQENSKKPSLDKLCYIILRRPVINKKPRGKIQSIFNHARHQTCTLILILFILLDIDQLTFEQVIRSHEVDFE